jgi:hypothetical protein
MRIALPSRLGEQMAAGYSRNYWILTCAGRGELLPKEGEAAETGNSPRC